MQRFVNWLCLAWRWLIKGIPGDIRSAVVGSICGSLVTLISAALLAKEPLRFSAFTNAQGYAQPLELLLSMIAQRDEKLKFDFEPPNLSKSYVCEFAQIEGATAGDLMLKYLDKYPGCFSVSQLSETNYRVFASQFTTDIKEVNSTFFCKCWHQ